MFFFFFFKQKTAYEMRISDWSSDVCSSDLVGLGHDVDLAAGQLAGETDILAAAADGEAELVVGNDDFDAAVILVDHDALDRRGLKRVDDEGRRIFGPGDDVDRSEERRVGTACVSKCGSGW